MSKLTFILLLLISSLAYSQKEAPINSVEIYSRGVEFYNDAKYEESLKEFEKIDRNDTNYVSALVYKSLVFLKLEKFEEGFKVCREGISLNSSQESSFYVNFAVLANKAKKYQEGLDMLEEGLKKYPKSYLLYYNKGSVYYEMKKFPEALEMYKECVSLNPYYAYGHLNLALLAADEGKITQAMLAFNMFLIIEPETKRSLSVIQRLNEIVTSKYERSSKNLNLSPQGGDDFSDMDLIVSNYAALSKGFKVPGKITLPVVKQNYALFTKLEYDKNDKGFWMQTYVPFFKEIIKQNKFEGFTYYSVQSSENEDHRNIVKKNMPAIDEFIKWAQPEIDKLPSTQQVNVNGKAQTMEYFFDPGQHYLNLISNTNSQNGKFTGYSEYYYNEGQLSAKGMLNANGEKEGAWAFYHFNGTKSKEATYVDGLISGNFKLYYDDGTLKSEGMADNGKLNGIRKDYSKAGNLRSVYTYKDNMLDGKIVAYYNNGDLDYKGNYVQDIFTDSLYEYYSRGKIASIKILKNNLNNGPVKNYFESGKLASEVNSVNGKDDGEYRSYYENGKIRKTGTFKEGLQVGVWKEYYPNGTLSDESPFDERGKLTGTYKSYDEDGKLFSELEYVKDGIAAFRYYDKEGKIFKEGKKQKGESEYKGYYINQVLKAEGTYTPDGKKGLWKYYDQYGNLLQEENYNNKGILNGTVKNYYTGGKLMDESVYENGEQEGYFAGYFRNGKIKREGWFINGASQGYWNSYFSDGTIREKNYYVKNKLSGYQQFFTVTGKLDKEEVYDDGLTVRTIYYDTLGAIIETVDLKKETGPFVAHYNNKNASFKGNYILGIAHGKFIWYNYDGKVSVEGDYYLGKKDGQWKWYDDKGKLKTIGSYTHGEANGKWENYYSNGKLKSVDNYENGNLSGEVIWYYENQQVELKKIFKDNEEEGDAYFYDETGALQMVRKYLKGKPVSYSYYGADGKLVPFIDVSNGNAKCLSYYQNGNKAREYEMIKGFYQGKFTEYFSNGKVHESITYLDDEEHGPYKEFYIDGKPKEEKNYVYGELSGICKYYYPNGNLEKELAYSNNLLHGKCNYYNEAGKLIKTKIYNTNEVIKEINY